MSDNSFDTQALIDLIDQIKATSGSYKLTYFCYSEPSEHIKEIIESCGAEYKVIKNNFNLSDEKENTVFIIPTGETPIKIVGEWNEKN